MGALALSRIRQPPHIFSTKRSETPVERLQEWGQYIYRFCIDRLACVVSGAAESSSS